MANSVVLKGSPYGISVVISEATDYSEIKKNVIDKFKSSENFFKGASIAISFEGDRLKDNYQLDLLNAIVSNTSLDIVCLIDKDEDTVAYYKDIVEAMNKDTSKEDEYENFGTIIRGNVSHNNSVDTPLSVIAYGDLLRDGTIKTNCDCVLLGKASGTIEAGYPDKKDAVCYSYSFENCTLSIGGITKQYEANAKGSKFKKKKKNQANQLIKAFVLDDEIHFETVNDIKE